MPSDGEFHLSIMMASLWISQLGIIYACHDNGLTRKEGEAYMRNFSLKCRKRIIELQDILIELEFTSKMVRNNTAHYRTNVDVDIGSFTGNMVFFMPLSNG